MASVRTWGTIGLVLGEPLFGGKAGATVVADERGGAERGATGAAEPVTDGIDSDAPTAAACDVRGVSHTSFNGIPL